MNFQGVRSAVPGDEEAIWKMLLVLHEENGIFTVSEQRVRNAIRYATERKGGVIGVLTGPAGIEASIGLELGQAWYTEDWCLEEKWCFVLPDYRRGGGRARRLIEYGKWCADQLGVPLQMGIMSSNRTEAKMRLYARQLEPIGGFFMHGRPH